MKLQTIQLLKIKTYGFQQVYNEIMDGYQNNKTNTDNETSFNNSLEFKIITEDKLYGNRK